MQNIQGNMLGNTVGYAAKKRKKPVQKIPKPPPLDGVKSNPSKRHRDRLNGELDRLTGLLPFPEEVCSRLDKLSVLRLSVGYLKVKSFFNATMPKNGASWLGDGKAAFAGNGKVVSVDGVAISEGDFLLQALNGFVLVITAEGYIFYASPTIQDYLGFHQSDVVHQSVFEMIHTDDRTMFRRQLHFALNPSPGDSEQGSSGMQSSTQISSNIVAYDPQHIPPENSSFLERSFCCRFRCLLDNSSGFLALNFQGRLKYLHGQNQVSEDGTPAHSQLALFAIATPVQPPSILEIRTKTLIFQTKHKLDFSPMGIDTRGKVVLGYSEIELCMKGSGYQFIHAADMMYCADNHMRMIKTGESGFTVFRLLAKSGLWVWVQANARVVFKGGRPDFIIARQRPLSNEEGEESFRKRRLQLPFNCTTGEGLLYDIGPSLDMMDPHTPKTRSPSEVQAVDPKSLLGSMLNQDQSVYIRPSTPDPQVTLDAVFMDSHALLSVPGDAWPQVSPQPGGDLNHDPTVASIMDSLEQIIGDSGLGAALEELDVKEGELKEWENTLLKMNAGADVSLDLGGILANDIFSYVEDELFKENGNPAGSRPADGSGARLGLRSSCLGDGFLGGQSAFAGTSRGLPVTGLHDSGLPGDYRNAPLPALLRQTEGAPQMNFARMGGQGIVGAGDELGGMQEVMVTEPQDTIRPNGPRVPQKDGVLSLRQPGFSAQAGLSHINPMPYNPALATPCAQTQVSQVKQGLLYPQTTSSFGSCPQKKLRPAPSSTVHPHSLALPLQNQQQCQLGIVGNNFEHQKPHIFTGQSNHAALEVQQGQWTIPSFEDNLQDVWDPNLASQQSLSNLSPGQHLQGRFSVQTQSLPSKPHHSWQPQQELPAAMCNRQHHPLSQPSNPYHQDPHSHPSPQISQNCRTACGYGTQNPVPAPSLSMNSCMLDGGPPSTGNRLCLGSMDQGVSMPPYQKLNSSSSQSSAQASCCFQNLPGNLVLGPSTSSQGSSRPCLMDPGFSLGDTMVQNQFLNCNVQPQVPGRPLEDMESFSLAPLSNGTLYFSENN